MTGVSCFLRWASQGRLFIKSHQLEPLTGKVSFPPDLPRSSGRPAHFPSSFPSGLTRLNQSTNQWVKQSASWECSKEPRMPPAVNRSALALYAHRLVEDGCRFRLHASPDKSPYLCVREIVDGERLRQFSLAPLEWVAREDVISAYERCLAGHELGDPGGGSPPCGCSSLVGSDLRLLIGFYRLIDRLHPLGVIQPGPEDPQHHSGIQG